MFESSELVLNRTGTLDSVDSLWISSFLLLALHNESKVIVESEPISWFDYGEMGFGILFAISYEVS